MPSLTSSAAHEAEILTASAFSAAITPVMPALTRYARRLAISEADTDDLVQDTLLKAWRARTSFRSGSNLRAWLMRIARNTFLSSHRRAGRQVLWEPEDLARALTTGIEQEAAVLLNDLSTAVAGLPAVQRRAFELIAVENLTYEDAAEQTGVEVGTLKSRVSRARMALMRALETLPQLPEPEPEPVHEAPRQSAYAKWKASGSRLIGASPELMAA